MAQIARATSARAHRVAAHRQHRTARFRCAHAVADAVCGGARALYTGTFTRFSSFSDERTGAPLTAADFREQLGAFKTPGLRGVAYTAPYGHAGSFGGLGGILAAHHPSAMPSDSPYTAGEADGALLELDAEHIAQLTTFLKALRLDLPAATVSAAVKARSEH